MTTLGGTAVTLMDLAKSEGPDGEHAKIVEMLEQSNEFLLDATFIECNDGNSHETVIRTGLPTATWRRYNEGVAPSKGTTAQVRAQTGELTSNSIIDKKLAEKGGMGRVAGVRAQQAIAHIMGLGQTLEYAMFYEDERVNPQRITGLAPHYATTNTATALSAENVIDGGSAGGQSDNTSVWLVCWGPMGITGLTPQGSKTGLQRLDRGVVDVIDSTGIAGATYQAYKEVFTHQVGMCVADWRQAVRICNIDVSLLEAESTPADLIAFMIEATELLGNRKMGNCAFYMNRTVRKMLRVQEHRAIKAGGGLTYENIAGKPVTMFDGIPVRIADSILNTETRLT